MLGKIKINNLAVECVIGIYEEERVMPQTVKVSVEITVDFAGLNGEISADKTVDWAILSEQIDKHLREQKYHLAEEAVKGVAALVLGNPLAQRVKVNLQKKFNYQNKLDCFEAELELGQNSLKG